MLFNACNCPPTSSGVSRRDLICCAGVGFVSALVGTLAGSGRVARARALGSDVPEIDRLAVTVVTDTQIIKFIPTEKRNDLTIERRPAGNVRPDAPPRADLVGEWGLSMHAQSQRGSELRNVLIDFGYMPETINNNFRYVSSVASSVKLAPARILAIVFFLKNRLNLLLTPYLISRSARSLQKRQSTCLLLTCTRRRFHNCCCAVSRVPFR